MVVWHKYRATERGTSDFGRCDIYTKISRDDGRSWESERLLLEADPADNNVQAPALRRLQSGDLLLICLRAHGGGTSSTMVLLRSTDDGRTFAPLSTVWSRSPGQWLQGGASSLLELQGGRLLVPYHGGTGHQGSQHNVVRCAFSDDGGRTWRRGKTAVDLPMRGAMEASVAELPDGELLMSLRTQLGAVFFSRSHDQGETWSLAQMSTLRAPESCTCLRCVPGTDDLLLLWNDSRYDLMHHHYGVRTPLSLALSRDRGATWDKVADIAHLPGYNFTNVGCDFTDDHRAVVTYCVYGPDRKSGHGTTGWENPEVFDLHAAILDVT
jgi:sialidase-1